MKTKRLLATIIALPLLAVGLTACGEPTGPASYTGVTVTDKERVCSGNADGGTDCEYRVYTDQGTFKNTDSMGSGKYNSADVQGSLQRGGCYDLWTKGYRNKFFSTFENIVKAAPSTACAK